MKKPIKFMARLPLVLKGQTRWIPIPPKLKPYLREGLCVQGNYLMATLPPFPNPAVARLRAKLRRQRLKWTETEDEYGFLIFNVVSPDLEK